VLGTWRTVTTIVSECFLEFDWRRTRMVFDPISMSEAGIVNDPERALVTPWSFWFG
jgi:hypothetical protein